MNRPFTSSKLKFIDFKRNFEEISILQQENKRDSKFRFREKNICSGLFTGRGRKVSLSC